MMLAATVDVEGEFPGQLKNIPLCRQTAAEALADARIHFRASTATASAARSAPTWATPITSSSKLGLQDTLIPPGKRPWWQQWLPNTACAMVASDYDLRGPRLSNSTACASGTIAILKAVRAIRDGQCDLALAGSSEAIHPLFAAGFYNMGVLADHDDPTQACRPFDANRSGFVMGEGAAMFVLERLEHAQERGAAIYAEVLGGRILSDARHVTSLDANSDALSELIRGTLRSSRLVPRDVAYVNAHGTGTKQNDLLESRGIRAAFGRAASSVCVSANKAMLGHLVNASGSVELAITALAPARRLRAADAESHPSRSGVRSRLHSARRPRAAAGARAQTLDRLRRPSGRHRAPPLDRPRSLPGADSASQGGVDCIRIVLIAHVSPLLVVHLVASAQILSNGMSSVSLLA